MTLAFRFVDDHLRVFLQDLHVLRIVLGHPAIAVIAKRVMIPDVFGVHDSDRQRRGDPGVAGAAAPIPFGRLAGIRELRPCRHRIIFAALARETSGVMSLLVTRI